MVDETPTKDGQIMTGRAEQRARSDRWGWAAGGWPHAFQRLRSGYYEQASYSGTEPIERSVGTCLGQPRYLITATASLVSLRNRRSW